MTKGGRNEGTKNYGFKIVFDESCTCKFTSYMTQVALNKSEIFTIKLKIRENILPFANRKFHMMKIGGERMRNKAKG